MGGPGGIVSSSGDGLYRTLSNNVNAKWIHDPGLRRLNLAILSVFSSAAASGYDGSLINGLLAIPAFQANLGDPNASLLGITLAATGWAVGSLIMIAASVIQCATSGVHAFFGTRVMLGVGLGISHCSSPPLTTEIAHPKHRGNVTNLFQAIWYWGAIVSAAVTLGTLHVGSSWSWRLPCLLQVIFPTIQLVGLLFVPESPRWLISKGRHDEALQILAKYHANGLVEDELVQFEYQEICQSLEAEREAAKMTTWATLVATKGNRHRLLICVLVGFMTQWAGNGIVSYYLAPILKSLGITSHDTQAGINLALQVWNAIMAFFGALAAEKFGRRPLWLISACGMLASFIVVTALSATFAEHGVKAAGKATVAFLFIFFGFYDIAFTPLAIAYPVEILPFNLRTRGFSISLTTVYGAIFFNQYVNPIALKAIHWKLYFVYIGTLSAMIPTIYFLFPETKGRTLEEIAYVFDGDIGEPEVYRQVSTKMLAEKEESKHKAVAITQEERV